MKQRFSYFVVLAVMSAPVFAAGTPGGDVAVLSKILIETKKQVKALQDQLEEAKAANDEILKVRDTLKDMKDEYEYLSDFNPKAEVAAIERWAEDFTNLDDLADAKSAEQRWSLLYGEVGKRFKKSGIKDEKKVMEEAKKLFAEQEKQRALLKKYKAAALELDANATSKDLQQQIASSTALTASLLMEQKIASLEKEIAAREAIIKQVEWDAEFVSYLGGKDGQ